MSTHNYLTANIPGGEGEKTHLLKPLPLPPCPTTTIEAVFGLGICKNETGAISSKLYPDLPASAPEYAGSTTSSRGILWGNFDDDMEPRINKLEGTIITQRPVGRLDSVIGVQVAKGHLLQYVVKPALLAETGAEGTVGTGIGNILLQGPGGCGKRYLCNALAGELMEVTDVTFMSISPSDIFGPSIRDCQENVKAVFELARRRAPCIIFIDKMEEMFAMPRVVKPTEVNWIEAFETEENKEIVIQTFLEQFYFFSPERNLGVTLIGTSTFPWKIDGRILSSIDHVWKVPYPTHQERFNILEKFLITQHMGSNFTMLELNEIASRTKGYTFADLFQLSTDIWKTQWKNVKFENWFKEIRGISVVGERKKLAEDQQAIIPQGWRFVGTSIGLAQTPFEEVLACLNARKPSVRDGVPTMWASDELELEYSMSTSEGNGGQSDKESSCTDHVKNCFCGLWHMMGTAVFYLLSQI